MGTESNAPRPRVSEPFCDECFEKVLAAGQVVPVRHCDPDRDMCMCCGLLPRSIHDN